MPAQDQIKKAVKDAEKLHAEVYGKDGKPPESSVTPPVPEAAAPPATSNIAPSGEVLMPGTPKPSDKAKEPQAPDLSSELALAEQRFSTLQGKYNAEVPRMAEQLRALEAELADAKRVSPAEQQAATPEAAAALTAAEREEYGEDFIDVMKRVAQEAVGAAAPAKTVEELAQEVRDIRQNTQQNTQANVYSALDRIVPGWEAVNNEPGFRAWLEETDVYSGLRRYDMMMSAFGRSDAARVAVFLKGYLQQTGRSASPTGNATQATAQPPPRAQLDAFVAPPTQGSAPPRAGGETGRIWTESEVKTILDAKAMGKLKGPPAEIAAIELEIHNAGVQGRIQPG